MIFSMTGFSALEQSLPQGVLLLELRAVNSRYLDIHFRCDDQIRGLESQIRELIGMQLSRGKIECRLSFIPRTQTDSTVRLDEELLQQLAVMQTGVQKYFSQSTPLSVADILRWPGVIFGEVVNDATLAEEVKKIVLQGLQELKTSRAREGEKLKSLILERIHQMELLVEQVKPLLPTLVKEYQAKLEAKLQDGIKNIEPERIAQEIVLFAQRIDVDEELTRLNAHMGEVRCILEGTAPAGKRLDFLMQELNREANTLGSKSVSVQTTQVSMELKVLIEQMREQIQNIE